ncbi:MAG TPA: hypothetical protein VML19_13190 [Verrucomicrobiae bacterium]|nr:hypothetical protein [Verrucomicrobiae bacterium]
MKIRPAFALIHPLLLVLILLGFGGSASAQTGGKEERTKSATKLSAMTGCIDEQSGHYVLVEDRTMTPIADLVADGFETESFAKHVGHKVTVRGTSSSNGAETKRPTFKVRSIETVSNSCGPNEPLS